MVDDIETGKVETIPISEDFFDRMKDLTDGVELHDDLN
jgi:hypothetical protein